MADIFNPDALTYYGLELSSQATNSDSVNSASSYWAGMIVPTVSKNVTSLQVVNWSHVGSFELMTIELRSDNGSGVPSATVLQSATFTPTANFNWNSIPITSQAVVAGTKYHIVVHSANVSGTNSLEMRRIDDPDNLFGNTFRVNRSSDSGSTWSGQGQWCGCVGFGYSDATFEGCGYGDWDQTSINNAADQWGEYFNPTTTFTASKIGFKVSKTAAGTPSADLTYVIMNADTATVLATGTVVAAGSVTTSLAWYDAILSSNITFNSGTNYRVYMTSAATVSPQYQFMRMKTVNNGNANVMTFGGTTNMLAQDSSGTYSTDSSRDVPFRLSLVSGDSISVSDSSTITDVPTMLVVDDINLSDSSTVTDAPTVIIHNSIAVNDTSAVTEKVLIGLGAPRGVAISGMEFAGSVFQGELATDYFNSVQTTYNYFSDNGLNIIRLPFIWERIQPSLNGSLNSTYLGQLDTEVAKANTAGLKVILDMHNFGRRWIIPAGGFTDTFSTGTDGLFMGNGITINSSSGSPASTLLDSQFNRVFAGSVDINTSYLVTVDMETTADSGQSWNGVFLEVFRKDDNNRYYLVLSKQSGNLQLYKIVNGVQTQIGSNYTFAQAYSTFYTLSVDVGQTTAGTITVKINGTTAISGSTDAGLTGGQVAFYGNGANWGIKNFTLNVGGDTTSGRTNAGSHIIGDGVLTTAHLADAWGKIAQHYNGVAGIYGYDIMNEPHDMPVSTTSSNYNTTATVTLMMQAAINAIRTYDTNTYVICELDGWATTSSFVSQYGSNPYPWWTDSAGKLVYSSHYYPDNDHSGSFSSGFVSSNNSNISGDVTPFFSWCQTNSLPSYVGEFGTPSDTGWMTCIDTFYNLCFTYNVWVTWWSAGDAYTANTNLTPTGTSPNYTDQPQMQYVEKHLGTLFTGIERNINVSDSSVVTDSPTVLIPTLFVNVSNSSAVTESVTVLTIDNLLVTDTSTATDVVSQILEINNISVIEGFPSGLMAYYKFDENTGSTVGDSANSNNGTWNGTLGSQWATGKINSGGNFNGSNNSVSNTSLSPAFSTTTFSFSLWAQVLGGSSSFPHIINIGGQTADAAVIFYSPGSSLIQTKIKVNGTAQAINLVTGTVPLNTWMHFAVTYDGTTITAYYNANAQTPVTASGTLTFTDNSLYLGEGGGATNFQGLIDEVGIWNRTLSAAEITQLYNAGHGLQFGSSYLQATESLTVLEINKLSVFDSSTVVDSPTVVINVVGADNINVSDSSIITDTIVLVESAILINVSDSSTVSDVVTQVLEIDNISVNDASAVTDVPSVAITSNPPLSINTFDNSVVLDVRRNYVINPSMEAISSWTAGGTTANVTLNSTDRAFLGTQSLKVAPVSGNCYAYQDVTVVPGQTYTFSAYTYISTYTQGGLWITIKSTNFSTQYSTSSTTTTVGAWTRINGQVTVPAGVTTIRFILDNFGGATLTGYWDSAQLELGSSLTSYIDGSQPGDQWDGATNTSTSSTSTGVVTVVESAIRINVSNTSAVTDSPTVVVNSAGSLSINVFDSSTAIDVITQVLVTDNISVSDTSSATDVVSQILVTDNINVSDSSAVTDPLDYALKFDGSQNYVKLSAKLSSSTTNWALEAIIKPRVLPLSGFGMVVYNSNDSGGYGFGIGGSNGVSGSNLVGLFGGVAWFDSGHTLSTAGVSYHIVMTRDTTTTTFYIDGVQLGTTSTSIPNTVANIASIGNELNTTNSPFRYFDGIIDHVKVYNAHLSSTDAIALTNGNQITTAPIVDFEMNEGTGITISDSKGSGITGTLTGSPVPVWVNGISPNPAQVKESDNLSVNDSSVVTDVVSQILETYNINTSDLSTVTDVISQILETSKLSVSDTSSVTDSPTVVSVDNIGVSDSSAVTDTINQILETDYISVADSSAVTDSSTVSNGPTVGLSINVSDSSGVLDNRENLIYNPSFESNVTDNTALENFVIGAGVILSQDTTTGAFGTSSAKIIIPASATFPENYRVKLRVNDTNLLSVVAGHQYNASFYAKTSDSRSITFTLEEGTATDAEFPSVVTSTSWQQFNYTFTPTVSGTAKLDFLINTGSAGTVWIDAVDFEDCSNAQAYFDGSSSAASWEGSANNSPSLTALYTVVLYETDNLSVSDVSGVTDVPALLEQTNINTFDSSTVTDPFSYALKFDGVQNYVLVKNPGGILSGSVNASMAVTFNAPAPQTQANGGSLYGERSGGNDIFEIRITSQGNSPANVLQFVYRDDAGTLNRVSGTTVVTDGVTHTVVVVKNGTSITIYLDGNSTPEATGTLTASDTFTNTTIKSTIGTDNSTSVEFKGTIGNVALYTRVLSASEATSYNSNAPISSANLVGLWTFTEGTGTTTADLSGVGNTGVLTGTPVPVWVTGITTPQAQVEEGSYISVSDVSGVTDVSLMGESAIDISVSDASTVTDIPTILDQNNISVFDSSAATDVVSQILEGSYPAVSDSSTVTDTVSQILEGNNVSAADLSSVSDSVSLLDTLNINVSDASTVTDIVSQVLLANYLNITDSSSVSDSSAIFYKQLDVSVFDVAGAIIPKIILVDGRLCLHLGGIIYTRL